MKEKIVYKYLVLLSIAILSGCASNKEIYQNNSTDFNPRVRPDYSEVELNNFHNVLNEIYSKAPYSLSACKENYNNLNYSSKQLGDQLLRSISSNNIDQVDKLLKAGANPNFTDKDCWSPLMFSALKSNTDIAKRLIESGAKVDQQNNEGRTALMLVDKNAVAFIDLLIRYGANPHHLDFYGKTANKASHKFNEIKAISDRSKLLKEFEKVQLPYHSPFEPIGVRFNIEFYSLLRRLDFDGVGAYPPSWKVFKNKRYYYVPPEWLERFNKLDLSNTSDALIANNMLRNADIAIVQLSNGLQITGQPDMRTFTKMKDMLVTKAQILVDQAFKSSILSEDIGVYSLQCKLTNNLGDTGYNHLLQIMVMDDNGYLYMSSQGIYSQYRIIPNKIEKVLKVGSYTITKSYCDDYENYARKMFKYKFESINASKERFKREQNDTNERTAKNDAWRDQELDKIERLYGKSSKYGYNEEMYSKESLRITIEHTNGSVRNSVSFL